ncbi:MAG: GntR family transcriptional regulator [Actinomycetaceae bacterium]|nr:GntR family transcriptional regulator [Actinomycetaceae bacterium]
MKFDNDKPLWTQLVDEFSRQIASGQWQPGQGITSVRTLALELGVNPNTVQKALAELERQGLAFPERTTGRFVTTDEERIKALQHQYATRATTNFIHQIRGLGMQKDQALDLLTRHWSDTDKDNNE